MLEKLLHPNIHLVTQVANLYHSKIPYKISYMVFEYQETLGGSKPQ